MLEKQINRKSYAICLPEATNQLMCDNLKNTCSFLATEL